MENLNTAGPSPDMEEECKCHACKIWQPRADFSRDEWRRTKKGNVGRCRHCVKDRNVKNRYGLSLTEVEEFRQQQDNLCAICKEPLGEGTKTHIDHNHKTGAIRGILCNLCNLGIGKFKDFVHRLLSGAAYLIRADGLSHDEEVRVAIAMEMLKEVIDKFKATRTPTPLKAGKHVEREEEQAEVVVKPAAEIATAPVRNVPTPVLSTPALMQNVPTPVLSTPPLEQNVPTPVLSTPALMQNVPTPVLSTPAPVQNVLAPVLSTPALEQNVPTPVAPVLPPLAMEPNLPTPVLPSAEQQNVPTPALPPAALVQCVPTPSLSTEALVEKVPTRKGKKAEEVKASKKPVISSCGVKPLESTVSDKGSSKKEEIVCYKTHKPMVRKEYSYAKQTKYKWSCCKCQAKSHPTKKTA